MMKTGVLLESFRLPFAESLKAARALGLQGVQIFAKGETVYDGMSAAKIREVRSAIRGEGLEISALCGDFGCRMFYYPEEMRAEIEREKRILALAKELGTDIVTTHIGVVPEKFDCREFDNMHAVCRELAEFADSLGGHFAVETGPEPSLRLKNFLDTLGSRGVGVNMDPANLVMCIGENPAAAVHNLRDYIVHTHAKDGKMLRKTDTRRLYAPSYFGLEPESFESCVLETPLGEGDVPWARYIAALKEIGYDGWLTIERECGDDPAADIAAAAKFLKKYL